MSDIICSGFGGQGILTAGLILAKTAMSEGLEVTWVPSYGSEMRGGTANCSIRIATKPVASPFVKNLDLLVAMNAPSVDKFESRLNPGAVMAVNQDLVAPDRRCRDDITVVLVPAGRIAAELENPRGATLVILAAAVAKSGLFTRDVFFNGVEKFFADKGKINPKNAACLERGWRAAA